MIKLTIDNSISKIDGLTIQMHKLLAKELSYTVDPQAIYFGGGYKPRIRTLLSAKGEFPTGLLYIVKKWLESTVVLYDTILDYRRAPQPQDGLFKLNLDHDPYIEQVQAAEAAKCHERGIITAPTGCGKSLITALIINKLQVPTLVVVPTLELKRQLTGYLKKVFGDEKVGSFNQKLPIAVDNVDAFPMKEAQRYGCVIIDEFHHSGAKTYRDLNKKAWNSIYYRFGLTATPFRSQDNERLLLESVLSKVIYRIDYSTAVNKGYIVPLEAYYIDLPVTKDIKGNPTSWPAMYSELVVNNKIRNSIIHELLLKVHVKNLSTLCLVKEIKHGQNLVDLSDLPFANGLDDATPSMIKAFCNMQIVSLIGTSGILGEGVDTRPCEYVIIAGLGKSKNAFMQQVGRAFRTYPGKESAKVIIFLDKTHKWTKAHFKAQCKILLEEYGVKAVKL